LHVAGRKEFGKNTSALQKVGFYTFHHTDWEVRALPSLMVTFERCYA